MVGKLNIKENISLKEFTTFKIGGPARFFVSVKTKEELIGALKWAMEKKQEYFILGNGSNILVNDRGFDGLVIENKISEVSLSNGRISVGAGLNLNYVIENMWESGLYGMEQLYWIPGTIGGAVRGNAGAYGGQISDVVKSVTFLDENLSVKTFNNIECEFNYRHSIFKQNKKLIILSVELDLKRGDITESKKIAEDIMNKRKKGEPQYPSAGCVFKNIKENNFNNFIKKNKDLNIPEMFIERKSISAGWLIENIGLKGKEVGGAKISNEHANFIINTNNAKASDVLELINLVKRKTKKCFNVNLEEEIQYVGF
ncbi:MAG: UDP-N-acetylmuramate dehydrogenase [Parcubacteria group bacterium Athens0714_16]|nr:MAG: UDP-N-acetylmuramate dehydrogenase [Parcubacteria group bacterium Athens0714_16]